MRHEGWQSDSSQSTPVDRLEARLRFSQSRLKSTQNRFRAFRLSGLTQYQIKGIKGGAVLHKNVLGTKSFQFLALLKLESVNCVHVHKMDSGEGCDCAAEVAVRQPTAALV